MKTHKSKQPSKQIVEGNFDNDPRTARERIIYPYTVEHDGEGFAIYRDGKFVGPRCDYHDKDDKLIPLLDCLNREHAKAFA